MLRVPEVYMDQVTMYVLVPDSKTQSFFAIFLSDRFSVCLLFPNQETRCARSNKRQNNNTDKKKNKQTKPSTKQKKNKQFIYQEMALTDQTKHFFLTNKYMYMYMDQVVCVLALVSAG